MNKICKNCKHWGKSDESSFIYRSCTRIKHDESFLTADYNDGFENDEFLDEIDKEKYREMRKELAVVKDKDGYSASLKTTENFSCILFEQQPK